MNGREPRDKTHTAWVGAISAQALLEPTHPLFALSPLPREPFAHVPLQPPPLWPWPGVRPLPSFVVVHVPALALYDAFPPLVVLFFASPPPLRVQHVLLRPTRPHAIDYW